jgi:hypothetical protein
MNVIMYLNSRQLLQLSQQNLWVVADTRGRYALHVNQPTQKMAHRTIDKLEKDLKKGSIYVSNQYDNQYGGADGPVDLTYTRDTKFTDKMKKALKVLLTAMKISIGVGSVIVTFGAGGDTIVEAISATISSGMFFTNLTEMTLTLAEQSKYMSQLFRITFENGPEQVKSEALEVLRQMIRDGQEDQVGVICTTLQGMLESIAQVVGDWISTFIPDDAGIVGTVITTVITTSSQKANSILTGLFNRVPPQFQELLKHPDLLREFLIGIIRSIEEGMRHTGATSDEMSISATIGRIKKIGQELVPGIKLAEKLGVDTLMLDAIFSVIKKYFEPNIDRATQVVGKVMPLIFIIFVFGEVCGDPSLLEEIKSSI